MIKDSGERREFDTGAVRDIQEGKGRCDLLPLKEVAYLLDNTIIECIGQFMETKDPLWLKRALQRFAFYCYEDDLPKMILEVSKHYEEGCLKYGERNWEKGIPLHCYIDSGVRHYLKWLRGDEDERHDRAFVWNMLGALWTINHKPELIDIGVSNGKADEIQEAERE